MPLLPRQPSYTIRNSLRFETTRKDTFNEC